MLVLDWRHRIQARSQVRIAIEDTLDDGLPRTYTKELYEAKCATLFEHMYESLPRRRRERFYTEAM